MWGVFRQRKCGKSLDGDKGSVGAGIGYSGGWLNVVGGLGSTGADWSAAGEAGSALGKAVVGSGMEVAERRRTRAAGGGARGCVSHGNAVVTGEVANGSNPTQSGEREKGADRGCL